MDNKQWLVLGAVALGALLLMPEKKKRKAAVSGLGETARERFEARMIAEEKAEADRIKALKAEPWKMDWEDYYSIYILPKIKYGSSSAIRRRNIEIHNRELAKYKQLIKEHKGKEKIIPESKEQMTLFGEIRLNTKKRCVPDITRKKIRCRVQEPKEFDGFFTRKSTTPGVEYVMGIVDGKGITQSVLFDKKIWSQPLAKNWFNKNIKRLLQRDKQALNMG